LVRKRSLIILCAMADKSGPKRQVCALCGSLYVAIRPAGWNRRRVDKLCAACLMLPKPPVEPYVKRDSGETTA